MSSTERRGRTRGGPWVRPSRWRSWWAAFVAAVAVSAASAGEEIRVAVASNFLETLQAVARQFEARYGVRVVVVPGSTGRLYAQIVNGAPFDAFFAADVERPKRLEQDAKALAGSRFTYALGKLVLWSPQRELVDENARVLERGPFRYLAIANPRFAPYGRAAEQVLRALGVREKLRRRIVQGENVAQALQFVHSGNAELGLVAWSQLYRRGRAVSGSYWLVPQSLYEPIAQQAVLLRDERPVRRFAAFVREEEGVKIIREHGYGIP